jgi:ribosomal protein S18 acetylase RimI-like enzyme
MERSALAAAIDRSAALAMRLHMIGDDRTERRHGLAVARRAGLVCLSSTEMPDDLFTRALGYGTFAPATQRQIDAAVRHYNALGLPTRFELMHGAVPLVAVRLLVRNGFREEKGARQVHVLELARPPRASESGELRVERVRRADAVRYAKLASRGFESKGPIGLLFERGWIRQLRSGRHAIAFIGYVRRAPAATGVLVTGGAAAGLYSGSVLPRFRGRAFQNAMIRARMRYGYDRGFRLVYAMSEPDNASARNVRDEGFVTRFEVRHHVREAG